MAQANRSASGAIVPRPADAPRVQNGPPFASAGPSAEAPAPGESVPAPAESIPAPAESIPAPAAAVVASPDAVPAPPTALTAPMRFETPPPSQVDAAAPPRPAPDLDPMPVTAADFEDEAAPGLLASLGSTRPTTAWLAVGGGALAVAFVVGLFVGRGTAPASAPAPATRVAASEPAPAPAKVEPTPVSALAPEPKPTAAPEASVAAPAPADSAATTDEAKGALAPKSLSPFNSKLANTSIASAAARIKGCKGVSVPPGSASVVVTFATTGRVVAAAVTTPSYSLGKIGSCVVAKLKTAQVPPFSGAPETVKKTINIR